MSRIGKKPVKIPAGVKATVDGSTLHIEGKLGKLQMAFRPEIDMKVEEGEVLVGRRDDSRPARALHGLSRALVANMMKGVTDGYEKKLEIVGVGYLAALQKGVLQLRVGFANEIQMPIPEGVNVTCPDQTHIIIKGIDKQKVGQFAAEIRSVRKPEPYKGKGIRYDGEVVRRKAGKAMSK
jgi:large subunit ribosomal protein L6